MPSPPLLNAPRTITVLLALLFTILGLSGTIVPIPSLNQFLSDSGYPLTRLWAHFFLAAAPVLLLLGALLRMV